MLSLVLQSQRPAPIIPQRRSSAPPTPQSIPVPAAENQFDDADEEDFFSSDAAIVERKLDVPQDEDAPEYTAEEEIVHDSVIPVQQSDSEEEEEKLSPVAAGQVSPSPSTSRILRRQSVTAGLNEAFKEADQSAQSSVCCPKLVC